MHVNLLEENIEANLHDLSLDNEILDTIQEHDPRKKKNHKLDFIKMRNVCSAKDTVKQN